MSRCGAPADNWMDGSHPRKKDPTAWVPIALVGALCLVVGCGGGMTIGWFAGVGSGIAKEVSAAIEAGMNADAALAITAPATVKAGESFTIVATVTDTRGEPRNLLTLDVTSTLVPGMQIDSSVPAIASRYADGDYAELTYNAPIPASGSATVTLTMRVDAPGRHTGLVEAYIDDYASVSQPIDITVTE